MTARAVGPLAGVRVVEMAGIGPAPMCAMLLADAGAEVVRVDRTAASGLGIVVPPRYDLLNRGRRSVAIDLKQPEGVETALRLVERADALIEGFRPGVMERLGLGPDECTARNPALVFGRMTGWGPDGPLANAAGHDLNYIALTGVLHAIGPRDGVPAPPLNLVGDFGGGALYLAFGILAALLEARRSGRGQVVDAAMVDGASSLMTLQHGLLAHGTWVDERGANILDGGAPYYGVYETADDRHVTLAAIEHKFWAQLLEALGLDDDELPDREDRDRWPELRERIAAVIRTRSRDEWCARLEGTDVCFAPVLSLEEAPEHPHNTAREAFVEVEGIRQPAPAPRFSRTPGSIQGPAPAAGEHTDAVLTDWGFSEEEIAGLHERAVVR